MLVINGLEDGCAPLRYAAKLAARLRCPLLSPQGAHAGILIEQVCFHG